MSDDDWLANLPPAQIGGNVVKFARPTGVDDMPPLPPLDAYRDEMADAHAGADASANTGQGSAPEWPTEYDLFNEAAVPPRAWIYGKHYLRGFVSVLASAGGIGKTSLQIVEALAICTGKPLLGEAVHEPCNVWIVNLEDPMDEMQRRILAAMRHFGIKPDEVRGKLFVDAGRDFRMKFATQTKTGIVPNLKLVEHLKAKIPERGIGAVFIDPFVGAHEVSENDNMAVNEVVAQVRAVADHTRCAFGLVHHIRKGNGEDANIDSVRGAGSLIGAARAARVINRISDDEATRLGIDPTEARGIFRVDDGKANLAPPADAAVYRRMTGVKLDNGDWVGVAEPYALPDLFDGVTTRNLIDVQNTIWRRTEDGDPPRYSDKAGDKWVGHIVAERLGLDIEDPKHRAKIKKMLTTWERSGALRKGEFIDQKRMSRPIMEVGEWAVE